VHVLVLVLVLDPVTKPHREGGPRTRARPGVAALPRRLPRNPRPTKNPAPPRTSPHPRARARARARARPGDAASPRRLPSVLDPAGLPYREA